MSKMVMEPDKPLSAGRLKTDFEAQRMSPRDMLKLSRPPMTILEDSRQ